MRTEPHHSIEYLGTVNIPDVGKFLVPLCVTKEELLSLLSASFERAANSVDYDKLAYTALCQAVNYIDNPELVACLPQPQTGDCIAYPSSANIIAYSPQNPFSEPDLTPGGYITPPFTRFADFALIGWLSTYFPAFTENLTGYLPDDIIIDISSIPTGSWTEPALGMPQIAIQTSGNGIAELHMINFPLGGRAIVTIDVQPNVGDILGGILGNQEFSIELNRDILSIPPETAPVNIYEVEINDEIPTTHTIYITFVPTVDDALIPINFGGGIRQVVLCGFDEVIMSFEDIRINGCELEALVDGQWVSKGSIQDCVAGITGPIEAQVTTNTTNITTNTTNITTNTTNNESNLYPPLPTITETDKLCGSAHYIANSLSSLVADALTSSQNETLFDWLDYAFNQVKSVIADAIEQLYVWAGANYTSGLATDVQAAHIDIAEILYCNELDKAAVIDDIQNSSISQSVKDAYINAIGAVTDSKWLLWAYVGSLDSSNDCSAFCPNDWIEYDFETEDYGFTVWQTGSRPFGTYVAGIGWKCTWNDVGGYDNRIYIEKINMSNAFDMTDIEVDYVASELNGAGKGSFRCMIGLTGQFSSSFGNSEFIVDNQEHTLAKQHIDSNVDGVRLTFTTDTNSPQPDAIIIKRIRIRYANGKPPSGGVHL